MHTLGHTNPSSPNELWNRNCFSTHFHWWQVTSLNYMVLKPALYFVNSRIILGWELIISPTIRRLINCPKVKNPQKKISCQNCLGFVLSGGLPGANLVKWIKASGDNTPRMGLNVIHPTAEKREILCILQLTIRLLDSSQEPSGACVRAKSHQLRPALCDPMESSPPDSSVPGILQARILEWLAMPSTRESSWPRDQFLLASHVSCTGRQVLYH